ncbi:MAG: hypothetical protein IT513_13375 [Burkholderiales bacterium]|nr:hypothetical protein [Burkholderiales bacterium]
MTGFTRSFTLVRTRTAQGAIADASGWTGCWPFRKRVSYHVGVNCDAISLSDGRLYVYRRGWTIAVAELRAAPRWRWPTLLRPRHARERSPWAW